MAYCSGRPTRPKCTIRPRLRPRPPPRVTGLDAAHSRNPRDRHRRPNLQRVRRARLHDSRGASANLGLAAPGRFHVLAGRARLPRQHLAVADCRSWASARGASACLASRRHPARRHQRFAPLDATQAGCCPRPYSGSSTAPSSTAHSEGEVRTGRWVRGIAVGRECVSADRCRLILFGGSVGDTFGQRRTFILAARVRLKCPELPAAG